MLQLYGSFGAIQEWRMTKKEDTALVPVEHISSSILPLRGHRVILDRDLAAKG